MLALKDSKQKKGKQLAFLGPVAKLQQRHFGWRIWLIGVAVGLLLVGGMLTWFMNSRFFRGSNK